MFKLSTGEYACSSQQFDFKKGQTWIEPTTLSLRALTAEYNTSDSLVLVRRSRNVVILQSGQGIEIEYIFFVPLYPFFCLFIFCI